MKTKKMISLGLSIIVSIFTFSCGKGANSDSQTNTATSSIAFTETSDSTTENSTSNAITSTAVTQSTPDTTTTTTSTTTQMTTTSYVDAVHYEPLYDYLVSADEGTGFFYDVDKDGYEDMILCDDFGLNIITYWNMESDDGLFGWNLTLESPSFYVVNGTNGKNYICCETCSNSKLLRLYCDLSSYEELVVRINYDSNGNASWGIDDSSGLSYYSSGKSSGVGMYTIPADCWNALNTAFPDYGMSVNSNCAHNTMSSMSYTQMKEYLLNKLGRSSRIINDNNSNEAAYGEGHVSTEGGSLNVRQSPSTSSSVVTQIPNDTKVYVEDDSYNGWLLIYGFNQDYTIFRGYVAEEFVDWHITY